MTDAAQAPIRVLVVDDEPLAREKICGMAADDPDIRVVAECSNGAEAIEAVQTMRPDLILLDVQMPEVGGFAVLEALKDEGLPPVIFITAYDHYAVRAFEFHALDYLLKPFDRERFQTAIERAKRQIRRDSGARMDARILALLEEMRETPRYSERLVVNSIHTGKKSYLLRETITSLESQLDPKEFVRIHRSAIVRLDRIKELQPWSHGEYHVLLQDGTRLTLSRSYREKLQAALGNSL
ncbi:MAG: DNA-binding response regulator [Acidobacteria bacterium]|nr:MAG: DNA-binding response regulator [Acidobacteriota bacterium]